MDMMLNQAAHRQFALAASRTACRRRHQAPAGGSHASRGCQTCSSLLYSLAPAAGHTKEGHPESPQRIHAIRQALQQSGLAQAAGIQALPLPSLDSASAAAALRQALHLVHPPAYLARLESVCGGLQGGAAMVDESTYITPATFSDSCQAAAVALELLAAVLAQPGGTCAFFLGRPPGHHVLAQRPMGFGSLNIISVAAAQALQHPGISKVAVIDFDVHHGNGTEDIFYGRSDLLYVSTHQAGLWPYTGKAHQTGSGEGQGYTINLPLPGGCGEAAMHMAWDMVVAPAVRRFEPDLILVSAGYDAHWRDGLAGLQMRSDTYHWLCRDIQQLSRELCRGRCMLVLEGGYDLPSLGESVCESFRGLLGLGSGAEQVPDGLLPPEPLDKAKQVLQQAVVLHGL